MSIDERLRAAFEPTDESWDERVEPARREAIEDYIARRKSEGGVKAA